jgi:ABC-2 type transport system ATP-binding protein
MVELAGPVGAGPFVADALRVQAAIAHDAPANAAALLQRLADSYAASDALRDEALLLVLETEAADAAPDSAAASPLRERLTAQLTAITAGFINAGGEQALAERAAREERLRESLRRAAAPREVVFRCQGLEKGYAGSDFHFGTLDLELRAGEITGVVGQNGHGKTTLLRMVAGELKQDAGSIAYPMFGQTGQTGERIDWVRVKHELAYVPQELPTWHGALADTLHFEAAMQGIRGVDNERDVRLIIERLGLAEHLGKKWAQLAGGFKLRFSLARALVRKPRLLVMDEPLANLDQKAKGLLLQDVRDLARSYRRPMAVLMSSHDLHGLELVCGQMVFLKSGQVAYAGPSSGIGDLHSARAHNEYEIGSSLTLDQLRQRLEGAAIESLREEGLSAIIVTRREVDRRQLLQLLLDRDVDVQYFRDNSRSVRRLFD